MSATNHTTYYNLPVFVATDEPKWLTDWNGAMALIDAGIAEAKTAADNAQTTASANTLAISGLSDSVSTMSTALGTLTTTVTTLSGTVNTITSLIGNGEPTTQDKTLIGAINELKAEIDALAPGGEVAAAEVSYDNTTSGLTADDVQEAIDELNTKIENIPGGGGADLNFVSNVVATLSAATGLSVDSDYSQVNVLTNTNASIGKIYGGITSTGSMTTTGSADFVTVFTITASNLPAPSTAYDINIGYTECKAGANATYALTRLHFNTDGTIDVQCKLGAQTWSSFRVSLPPCIYILKDLGD